MATAPAPSGNLPAKTSLSLNAASNSASGGGPVKSTNVLTSKISSVLSTSYSDTEFRDALSLLDDRGIRNDSRVRRQLKLDLLKEVIGSNAEIIQGFGRVAEQLKRIRGTLDKINAGYENMKIQLLEAHRSTLSTLSETSSLMEQRTEVETKQGLLKAFKAHFIMIDDDLAALTQVSEPVNDHFFEALAKAKKISKDCEVLLGFEKQNLGLELLEQTSRNINLGFNKLYKWVQREFRTLNLENPQMNPLIRKSLRVLAERSTLFQNCLDSFANARERILTDSFYTALTGTTNSKIEDPSVKPIDLAAHDPLRYVGDMLAWVHSAAVSEREALEVLFVVEGDELAKRIKSGRDTEVWRLVADDDGEKDLDFNALNALNDLVDRDISGAAHILRQRVEHVIRTNEEVTPAYKLANLLNFYRATFRKLLGKAANLLEIVEGLETEALRHFRALERDHIVALQKEFQITPSDFGPPKFLQECLSQLETIAKIYDASLSAADDRESDFESILSEAFEPFISGCEYMAKAMGLPNSAIFLINCKAAAAKRLRGFDFTQMRAGRLQQDMDTEKTKLVESQYDFLVRGSGLSNFFKLTQDKREPDDMLVDEGELGEASHDLDDFLPSALMDAMGQVKHLQDSNVSREITEEAAERFCQEFEKLELVILQLDEKNGYEGKLRSIFPRTTPEIRVLLS